MKPSGKVTLKIILVGGLAAGTLDILAAIVDGYFHGTSAVIIFKFIASGVLGLSAFSGSTGTALLGLFFHYCIAFGWTIIFYLGYINIQVVSRFPISSGAVYGILVWIIMNKIILPLSNVPLNPNAKPKIIAMIRGVSYLVFFLGITVALIIRKLLSHETPLTSQTEQE